MKTIVNGRDEYMFWEMSAMGALPPTQSVGICAIPGI